GSGQGVSWLRLVDEYTGAFLGTAVFPPLPLGPRPRGGRAAAAALGLRPLGAAAAAAGGQRQAVGLVERPTRGCGPVAARPGHPRGVERPALPAAERRRRAAAGGGQALGRAAGLPQRGRVAGPARCRRRLAARALPAGGGAEPLAAVPRPGA